MSFTIGRASFTTNITALSQDGDRLEIEFNILPATLAAAKALRQQVLGLAGNDDEPVIPFTWSSDSDFDGFYRVTSAQVEPVQTYQTNRLMRCSVSLERISGGFAVAPCSLLQLPVQRSTANHTVVESYSIWIPDDRLWADMLMDLSETITTETGDVIQTQAVGSPSRVAPASFGLLPADYYDGACLIEYEVGSTWYTAIGQQLPILTFPETGTDGAVRVSNSLVRATFQSDGDLDLEVYDGTTWDAVGTFNLSIDSTPIVITPQATPSIVRNGPERCTIRIPTSHDTATNALSHSVYLSVERGEQVVDGAWDVVDDSWVIGASSTTAATDATGAIYQTSVGGTGHRWMIASPADWTADTTNGEIESVGSDTTVPFGLGALIDGESYLLFTRHWWCPSSPRQTVVAP